MKMLICVPLACSDVGVLFATVGLVSAAKWVNNLGDAYWKDFAGQNYFDERGVFISVMFSMPLLVLAFCMLVNALRMAASLLIEVKKLQLKAKRKRRAKQS